MIRDIFKKIMEHFSDPNYKMSKEDRPEIEREIRVIRELLQNTLSEDELPSEDEKVAYFQRLLNQYQDNFTNPDAVKLIELSCREAGVSIQLKVANKA